MTAQFRPGRLPQFPDYGAWGGIPACVSADGDAFFPDKGDGYSARAVKRVCDRCTVREACLQYALDNNEQYGIWGGRTERERKRLRNRRAA